MPGYLKANGTQRVIGIPYIKVGGAWRTTAVGWVKVNGTWRIWHAPGITDNFNRTNASTLGTASDGFSQWTTNRGTWSINSNRAVGNNSTYPIATAPLYKVNTDVTIKADVANNGDRSRGGVTFWGTDAYNWWGATYFYQKTTTTTNGYYYCPNGGTLSGTTCTQTYTATRVTRTRNLGCRVSGSCSRSVIGTWEDSIAGCTHSGCEAGCSWIADGCRPDTDLGEKFGTCTDRYYLYTCNGVYQCSSGNCTSTYSATYVAPTTSTSFTRRVAIVRATGDETTNSVSTLSEQSVNTNVQSLQVTTSGTSISVIAYSGTGQQTPLVTLTNTATTTPTGIRVGLVGSATSSETSNFIDNYSAV